MEKLPWRSHLGEAITEKITMEKPSIETAAMEKPPGEATRRSHQEKLTGEAIIELSIQALHSHPLQSDLSWAVSVRVILHL